MRKRKIRSDTVEGSSLPINLNNQIIIIIIMITRLYPPGPHHLCFSVCCRQSSTSLSLSSRKCKWPIPLCHGWWVVFCVVVVAVRITLTWHTTKQPVITITGHTHIVYIYIYWGPNHPTQGRATQQWQWQRLCYGCGNWAVEKGDKWLYPSYPGLR